MAMEFAAMALGVLALLGLVAGILRWTERVRRHEHEAIRAFNALLERVAKSRSLSYSPTQDQAHPVVGSIPAYGTLSGTIDGLGLRLSVVRLGSSDGPYDDRIELVLHAKDGDGWAASTGPKADVGPGFSALGESAELLEVGASRLRTRPRCSPSGSDLHVTQWLFKRDEELVDFLDLAVRAWGELRAR